MFRVGCHLNKHKNEEHFCVLECLNLSTGKLPEDFRIEILRCDPSLRFQILNRFYTVEVSTLTQTLALSLVDHMAPSLSFIHFKESLYLPRNAFTDIH